VERDIKLSNVKGLLIFLVVLGHLLSPYQDKFYGLYLLIYTFHMPLFILLTGYFAKRTTWKKIINLLLIYLIFQPVYRYFIVLIGVSDKFVIRYEHPYYQLWYLSSMITWSVILLVINNTAVRKVNKAVLVGSCFIIAVTSRVFAGHFLAMMLNYNPDFSPHTLGYQRTLSFLPYFFLGASLGSDYMRKLYQSLKASKLITLVLALGLFFFYTFGNTANLEEMFKGISEQPDLTGTIQDKFIIAFASFVIALTMCYVILNAVTSRKCILTKWGDRSLSIFIFHMFFTRAIEEMKFLGNLNQVVLLILLLLLALLIVWLLSTELFIKYTSYLLNPLAMIETLRKHLGEHKPKITDEK
jgi:fucose 4-O-acetylase-like acetyltransferase